MHTFHKLLTPVGSGVPRILGLFYSFKILAKLSDKKIFRKVLAIFSH